MLQSSPKTVTNSNECLRLWSHECLRVFSDRMIETKDTEWFFQLLCTMLKDKCKKDWSALIESGEVTLTPTLTPTLTLTRTLTLTLTLTLSPTLSPTLTSQRATSCWPAAAASWSAERPR